MNWRCFGELTNLEQASIAGLGILGLILIGIGFRLLLHPPLRDTPSEGAYDKWKVKLPLPLACVVLGAAAIGGPVWWLREQFPANGFSFSQRTWTLAEVKERVAEHSPERIELVGDASSFQVKNVSGTCASDAIDKICRQYGQDLKCDYSRSSVVIITKAQPR